jgi:hypothetical protein
VLRCTKNERSLILSSAIQIAVVRVPIQPRNSYEAVTYDWLPIQAAQHFMDNSYAAFTLFFAHPERKSA